MNWTRWILAMSLILGVSSVANAQIGTRGGPMDITADSLEVLDTERRAVFTGNVDAAQGDANLRSDRLEVFFAERQGSAAASGSSWGAVDRVIATGEVFYVTPEEVARGDRAVYQLTTETIVMTGDVVLRRDENVITGTCLTVDLVAGTSQVNSPSCAGTAPANGNTNAGGRVRAVIFPSNDGEADDSGEASE